MGEVNFGKLYALVEETRIKLWRHLVVSNKKVNINVNIQEEAMLPTEVSRIENGYKVLVRDILPRNKEFVKRTSLQTAWFAALNKAFFSVNHKFEKLLVIIVPYLPTETSWDVDNRPFKFIIDMCKYMKLVPDDTWKYVTFMVIGKVDQAHPRTEIYLLEMPKDGIIKLPQGIQ